MTFSVWAMLREICAYCLRERGALIRHGAIPFAVIAFVTLIAPTYLNQNATLEQKMIGACLVAAQLLVCVPLTVTWYRMVVLGKDEGARQPIFIFGQREWRLLGWQLAVAAGMILVFSIVASALVALYFAGGQSALILALCVLLGTAGLVGGLVVIVRVSFVFALAATDQSASFRASWDLTRGLTWPLLSTFGLICFAQSVVAGLSDLVGGIAAAVIHGAAEVFTFATMATLFGFVYVRVRGGTPQTASPA